jgi:hypothetical protein
VIVAFPIDPLPISVDIAPGASPSASPDTWDSSWVDITDDVRVAQGIGIEEGIPDEANQADPGACTLTLDNRSGNYSPRNPLGQWYGSLAKNTPLRVRLLRGKDSFARVTSNGWGTSESGIVWSNSGQPALSVDGTRGVMSGSISTIAQNAGTWDFDMSGGIAINAMPGAGGDYILLVNFRRNGSTNTYQFWMDVQPAGTMALYFQRVIDNSTTFIVGVSTPSIGTVVANTRYNFRLKVQGGFIGAKVWLASGSEPTTWLMTATGEGAYTMDNTDLGTNIQLQSSKSGTPTTSIGYWYDVKVNSYPFVGTVPEWPVRWDKSGKDSTTPLKAAGVLRRLQQGKAPLKSPLYAYLDQFTPAGLWMLEDESGATVAASQTSGAKGAYIYSTSPGGWNGPILGGTSGTYTVAVDTTISATLPRMTPSSGWSFLFAFYMPVLPVTNPLIFRVRASGTVTAWDVRASDDFGGVIYLVGTLPDGTVVANQSFPMVPGRWNIGQVEIQQATSSTLTGRMVCYDLTTGLAGGNTSASISGTIGSPQAWALYGSTGFQDGAAGPVAFYPSMSPVYAPDLAAAGIGFAGEDAGTRITRVARQAGVPLDLISGGESSLLGRQTADTLLAVMGEAADTDLGLLTEFRGGLRYRTRGSRYDQRVRMALDMSQGHIAEPPEPTDDDQRLRNDITVNRKDGASARAFDSASIAVHQLYDTSVDINPLSDDDLLGHASFRLYLGTRDELRWPSIILDLAKGASLSNFLERATALDPGAYVTVANPPTNLPVGTLHLLVEAVRQTIGPYEWRMELTCSSYTPWRIPNTASTTLTLNMDLVGSSLASTEAASTVGATDTWSIANSGNSWDAAAVPFNWEVGGEIVTVTALTGTSTQTATVTRGVGGIVKSHSIGEVVHLAAPLYVAL